MTTTEILTAAGIHFLVPIIGLLYFLRLRNQMIQSQITNPPVLELFLVFAIYGVLLILLLTALFWEWSAAALLGTLFSIFIAPILMAFISVRLKMAKPSTSYHLALQKAAVYYFIAFPIGIFVVFSFANG